MSTMEERIAAVQSRIQAACARSRRSVDEVSLIAVSKTHGPEAVKAAADAGLMIFGENKVQEAAAKIPLSPGHVSWHLVGHLQRNKAAKAAELFDMIHSMDSVRILEALDRACDEVGKTMKVLIETNVSGEASKFGVKPEELSTVLEAASRMNRIEVRGLMTMPPFFDDPEKTRPHFVRLRELRDAAQKETGIALPELSMGMSHDFEVAIEEGAHWIRVGTAIFGSREKPKREPEEE